MDPIRAAKMGVRPENIKVETLAGKFGGWWFVHVPEWGEPENGRYAIVTQARDIYKLIRWQVQLKVVCDGA